MGAMALAAALWIGVRSLGEAELNAPPAADAEADTDTESGDLEVEALPVDAAPAPNPELALQHLNKALEFEKLGDLSSARASAEQAMQLGGGRNAQIQVAKIAILERRYDQALRPLDAILGVNPKDPDALYNRALVWQSRESPNYNEARNGYLAALEAEPRYAAARSNLVILCVDHGVLAEAKHHFDLFEKRWPQDPRLAQLRQKLAGANQAPPKQD